MKIAIPCENGEVMQHFGHATEFTVYTIEDIKPIEKETVTFDDTDHEKVAGGLKSRGVDLVICGNIGEGAHAAIDNAHMLLISGVTGNADEAVDSFLQGNLELMTGDSNASAGGCGAGCGACRDGGGGGTLRPDAGGALPTASITRISRPSSAAVTSRRTVRISGLSSCFWVKSSRHSTVRQSPSSTPEAMLSMTRAFTGRRPLY